jgi:hypothetical protein
LLLKWLPYFRLGPCADWGDWDVCPCDRARLGVPPGIARREGKAEASRESREATPLLVVGR